MNRLRLGRADGPPQVEQRSLADSAQAEAHSGRTICYVYCCDDERLAGAAKVLTWDEEGRSSSHKGNKRRAEMADDKSKRGGPTAVAWQRVNPTRFPFARKNDFTAEEARRIIEQSKGSRDKANQLAERKRKKNP
jgi:hypothetical protein